MFGKRILILVPHPDDEAVACAAAITRAQAQGAEIFALYLTHGCIAREALWPWQQKNYDAFIAHRRAEGEEAAQFLGITPVGWASRPARHVWRQLPEIYAEVKNAVAQYHIDQLWVPAYEGGNADHDGANAIGSLIASQQRLPDSLPLEGRVREGGDQLENPQTIHASAKPLAPPPNLPLKGGGIPPVLEFAEYNFYGGKMHSQKFPSPNGSEQILTLTPLEQNRKRAALQIYASEKRNLNYVKCERECYRPLARYDYTHPPHAGTLFYARFQWVPFRHPRVDFTQPEEVSKAITAFLATNAPPAPAKQ